MTTDEKMKRCGISLGEAAIDLEVDNSRIQIITSQEIALLHERGIQLHANEFGICAHDILQAPCPRYKDCINCTEQICIVGDAEKADRIEAIVQHAEQCLKNALHDKEFDVLEADQWIDQQKRTIENGKQLLDVLHDKRLPEGTMLKRTWVNGQYEPFLEAATARAELTGADEDRAIVKLLTPQEIHPKTQAINNNYNG